MSGFPETPEAVALLMMAIIAMTTEPADNIPRAAWLLDLYTDCLAAARGEREKVDGGAH